MSHFCEMCKNKEGFFGEQYYPVKDSFSEFVYLCPKCYKDIGGKTGWDKMILEIIEEMKQKEEQEKRQKIKERFEEIKKATKGIEIDNIIIEESLVLDDDNWITLRDYLVENYSRYKDHDKDQMGFLIKKLIRELSKKEESSLSEVEYDDDTDVDDEYYEDEQEPVQQYPRGPPIQMCVGCGRYPASHQNGLCHSCWARNITGF